MSMSFSTANADKLSLQRYSLTFKLWFYGEYTGGFSVKRTYKNIEDCISTVPNQIS